MSETKRIMTWSQLCAAAGELGLDLAHMARGPERENPDVAFIAAGDFARPMIRIVTEPAAKLGERRMTYDKRWRIVRAMLQAALEEMAR